MILLLICICIIIIICILKILNQEHFKIKTQKKFKVLYIIRSIPKYYESRLKSQYNTWMKLLSKNDMVLVASDNLKHKDKFNLKYSTPKGCPRNHGDGPCCSESNAIVKALKEFKFDWVFILDDDVYLYPKKVREILYKYRNNHNIGLGTTGCVAKGIGGFCGGGGYGFSRKCLKKIVGNDYDKFLKEYKLHCDKTQFCDITTADMAKQKGIELKTIPEFKPWGIKKTEKDEIKNNNIATLHYYGGELTNEYKEIPDKMNYLHSLFINIKEKFINFKEHV
jgi:hypothetical protein